mgnify:CR=1 FL=1
MLAVALGLISGLSWGVADFLGGIASRRAAVLTVVALSQTVGLTLALDEGLEVNLLGLVLGIDPMDLAIKLPGLGRIGWRQNESGRT